jgi:hypothetical protein
VGSVPAREQSVFNPARTNADDAGMMRILVLVVMSLCWAGPFALAAAPLADAIIPSVSVGGVVYSNVVVESVNAKTISFKHARGMGSLNVTKLSQEERRALGLAVDTKAPIAVQTAVAAKPAHAAAEPVVMVTAGESNVVAQPAWVARLFKDTSPEEFVRSLGAIALAIVFALVLFYLFWCLCLLFICRKTETPSPVMVWIPILQMSAAYRAAGMSSMWFKVMIFDLCFRFTVVGLMAAGVLAQPSGVGMMLLAGVFVALSLVNIVGWIIWCFKICIARNKSPWLGLLVLFPITQPPTLGYLAFSK